MDQSISKRSRPIEFNRAIMERKRLFLHSGDRVLHKNYPQWGLGEVVEEWRSEVPGGFCFVRVAFQDGKKRVFDNDFDSVCCCFYTGVRVIEKL